MYIVIEPKLNSIYMTEKEKTELSIDRLVDSISNDIDTLELLGGQFLLEIDGKEYTTAGFSKLKSEIIIHAFNE